MIICSGSRRTKHTIFASLAMRQCGIVIVIKIILSCQSQKVAIIFNCKQFRQPIFIIISTMTQQKQLDLLEHLLHSSSSSEKSEAQDKQEVDKVGIEDAKVQDNNAQSSTKQNSRKRYKYCCRKCKHPERGRKSCVCVVPRTQRRTQIGCNGCQTCGCKGCSIQDFQFRGQDPQYHPATMKNDQNRGNYHQQTKLTRQRSRDRKNRENSDSKQDRYEKNERHEKYDKYDKHDRHEKYDRHEKSDKKFDSINGCCKLCMKAFSKTGKACVCQVPKDVRKSKLPPEGCKICGCTGCHPRDRDSQSRSRSRSSVSQFNSSSQSRQNYDERQFRFNNIDRSNFGQIIIVEYGLNPGMLGLGIPQRTPSYILGKPQ